MSIDHRIFDCAMILMEDMDRARSLTVAILLRYSEWGQLVNLYCSPAEYLDYDGEGFRLDYQAYGFFKKVTVDIGIDKRGAAISTFFKGEEQCRETNYRLGVALQHLKGSSLLPPAIVNHVLLVRSLMEEYLGKIPESFNFDFTPGSTYNDRRFMIEPQHKMRSGGTIYQQATSVVLPFWYATLWYKGLAEVNPYKAHPKIIRGNRAVFVPKSAKTDRMISPEASLCIGPQRTIGVHIAQRLRRKGRDLSKLQSHHKKMVAEHSVTRCYSTLDLSNASGTMSWGAVKLALPETWFDLVSCLRAPCTKIDGTWHTNEHFSSQGNGYTFELETLLFTCICEAIRRATGTRGYISVYGDDIIVPSSIASDIIAALKWWGFTTNIEKSFIGDSPFRESCGYDAFNGIPCRPYYTTGEIKTSLDIVSAMNGLYRAAEHDRAKSGTLGVYGRAWKHLLMQLPHHHRVFGPSYLGDIAIAHDDCDFWKIKIRDQQWYIKVLSPVFTPSCKKSIAPDTTLWPHATFAAIVGGYAVGKGFEQGKYPKYIKPRSTPVSCVPEWQHFFMHESRCPGYSCLAWLRQRSRPLIT